VITLNDDLTLFGGPAHTTLHLQHFAQFLQVLIGSAKSGNECDRFPFTVTLVEADAQLLLFLRQCLFRPVILFLIMVIGVGGIDNIQSFFSSRSSRYSI
jgi:hypothetical protein